MRYRKPHDYGRLGYHLNASGPAGVPVSFRLGGLTYRRLQVFKHDFFAATALYGLDDSRADKAGATGGGPVERVVLKLNRNAPFLGIPLGWLGRELTDHEYNNLKLMQGTRGIPVLLGRFETNGLVYAFVEGRTLAERPSVPDDFFDQLNQIVEAMHQRGMAYVDLNKRGNIILGQDQQCYLIDFQISWQGRCGLAVLDWLCGRLLNLLQQEDFYHIRKHKRRFRPDLMSPGERQASRRLSLWIRLHRRLTRPLTLLRRRVLAHLYRRGELSFDDVESFNSETNPERFARR